jgi:hypothetical protein
MSNIFSVVRDNFEQKFIVTDMFTIGVKIIENSTRVPIRFLGNYL